MFLIFGKNFRKNIYMDSKIIMCLAIIFIIRNVDNQGLIYKYGEFFPLELSPFGYNATTAQEFFPLAKEEIIKRGYKWKEPENKNYKINILPENLPDSIDGVDEEILSKVIGCEHKGLCNETCTTVFKIIPEEFKFYKIFEALEAL